MGLMQRLEDMRGDLRQAVRQLISAPGFTVVASLTLALGVGVNSAIFALADAALMRPLPFGQTERLVMLWESMPTVARSGVSPLDPLDPLTFLSVPAVILCTALVAAAAPAWRASRIDPVVAFRQDH